MNQSDQASWVAFAGTRRIHSGMPSDVARAAKLAVDQGEESVLVFDDASRVVDIDYRGSDQEVISRLGHQSDVGPRTNGNGGATDSSPYLESTAPRGTVSTESVSTRMRPSA